MLLRHSLELSTEADVLEAAVTRALEGGARTADIASPNTRALSTREMGDAVLANLAKRS
jgi:3-isopropylmalate dehydrogenase